MKNIFACISLLIIIGCNNNEVKTDIVQKNRNEIVNVKDKIVDIKSEIIFGNSLLYIIDDILIVHEVSPKGMKGIHLFNKNTFQYLTSTGFIGRGPGEIIIPGCIGIDKINKSFWVLDHGNSVMWQFPLDSVLHNDKFHPGNRIDLNSEHFIDRFDFLNDSIVLGKAVQMVSRTSFKKVMSKFNFKRNEISQYGYENPLTEGKFSYSEFALSPENNIYVNCYYYCDLITICDLEGNLKFNIYGHENSFDKEFKKSYFFGVHFYKENIVASYIGEAAIVRDDIRPTGNTPSKFHIFNKEGKYLKTIETGYKFTYFCVDEDNDRLIAYYNGRKEPLGYFSLK